MGHDDYGVRFGPLAAITVKLTPLRENPTRTAKVLRFRAEPYEVLQRPTWNGTPVALGDLFRLQKTRGEQTLEAVCRLFSHSER